MATGDRRSARRAKGDPGTTQSSERPGIPGVQALDRSINHIFGHDDIVQTALTTNLKPRTIASQAVVDRAAAAFARFTPSALSAAERAKPNYLGPRDDVLEAMTELIDAGTRAMRADTADRSLRLALSPELKRLIQEQTAPKGKTLGTIELGSLIDFVNRRLGVGPVQAAAASMTACTAEIEAERRLQEIERTGPEDGADATAAHTVKSNGSRRQRHSARRGSDDSSEAVKLVRDQVERQMSSARSPEQQIAFPQRSDQDTHSKAVQTFELRDGPSDVTSYHDFSSLQIAFRHVWTEVFDGELTSLGNELYQEYVKLKVFTGTDDGKDRPISTLDDLRQLIDEVRTLSLMTDDDLPGGLKPADSGNSVTGPTGAADLGTFAKIAFDPFSAVTGNIKDEGIRALVDPAGALFDLVGKLFTKPRLTWQSFPGPLPSGDLIEVSVEEDVMDPGTVAIVVANTRKTSWWKGIEFRELGVDGTVTSDFKISTDPEDQEVWDRRSYNALQLRTSQLRRGVLEFQKAAFLGHRTGFYVLTDLDQKIKDRARVTFTWLQD